MASLSEIQSIVQQIHQDLPALIQRARINPQQVVLIEGLADLSKRLGLIQAGEFRAGNDKEPGFGFTGGRFGYPGFSYDGATYFLAGVENDVLQVGMALANGSIVAGGGDIVLDSEGISIANTAATSGLQFLDDSGNRDTIHIVADANNDLEIVNIAQTPAGTISFFIKDSSGVTRRPLHILKHASIADMLRVNMDVPAGGTALTLGTEVEIYAGAGAVGRATWFNEQSRDIDFRIGTTGDANFFTVDAGLDAIGIGGAAGATAKLKVYGAFNATGTIYKNGVAIGYPLVATSANNTPADSTTYYFGAHPGTAITTTAQRRKIFVPCPGTVKRVDLFVTCVTGSNEQSTVSFRLNDTTDTAITTTLDLSANPAVVNTTGLSIAVAAGDYFEIKWVTPAWVTNPTSVSLTAQVWIEF
jgi:hypothetical protein